MSGFRGQLFGLLAAACCVAAAALPAAASAELQTLDFESGPALETPVDGVGAVSFPRAEGFRPYRVEVGSRAHSGTVVGDIGRCGEESSEAAACEFFDAHTLGRLARTADRISLFAGRFGPIDPTSAPEFAVLTVFRANGSKIAASGPVPVDDAGFDAELSVSSAAGDIAAFSVEAFTEDATGGRGAGGDLGIDDVKVSFASGAKPDFAVNTTNQIVPLVQGQSADVPVTLGRVNGSNGPVQLTVANLPKGVSAKVTPNPLPGAQTAATITLTAAPDAPDTNFQPVNAVITADPLGNPDVGPAPRTAVLGIRVAADFGLSIEGVSDPSQLATGRIPISAPDCAAVDVPLQVGRDIAFNRSISLSVREDAAGATGLPPGVSVEILPSPIVPPGGGLVAERTLRIRATTAAELSRFSRSLLVTGTTGTGANVSSHTLPLELSREKPLIKIETPRALTPRFGEQGTRLRIHSTGYCPGTTFEVGNELATATPELVDDHTAEVLTPPLATSGRVVVIPPGGFGRYASTERLSVDSVRNSDGFQFKNNPFGSLSLSEFTRAFGADDLFIKINPCWPFGDCSVPTGILNPISAADWAILNSAMHDSKGAHCFGISLAIQRFKSGRESYREFSASDSARRPTQAFDLRGPDGPPADLNSFLDAMHVRQTSEEFISAYFDRSKAIQAQLDQLEAEFAHRREPIVSMRSGLKGGHVVLAYDMRQTPTGADIYVYDNNFPFEAEEDGGAELHKEQVERSVIHVDKVAETWSTLGGRHGGNDGSLWVVPFDTIPNDPSLPGLGTLKEGLEYVIFGSADGSARPVASPASKAEFLPDFHGGSTASFDGTWIKRASDRPLDVSFEGLEGGTYSQAYVAGGFTASVSGVQTGKGVRDHVTGAGDSMTFSGGIDRPLEIKVARESNPGAFQAATLETHGSASGSDTAGFTADGDLTYAHDGAPTTVRFSLTSLRTNGGPTTFKSGPVRVGRGERIRVNQMDPRLHRMRLTIHRAGGRTITRMLRTRGRSHRHLAIRAPQLSRHRIVVPFGLAGFHGRAIVGAVLRLMHGKHLVAQHAVAIRTRSGQRKVTWRLPRAAKHGGYRLLANFRAVSIGARGATGSASVKASRGFRALRR